MPNNHKKNQIKPFAIKVKDNPDIKRAYSNYVSVSTARHECNLNFCLIESSLETPSKPEAKVMVKIMIPNSLVKEVLRVINLNYENTMKRISEIESKK